MVTIQQNQLQDYLTGSLHYAAMDWRHHPRLIASAVTAFRHVTGHGHYHLPFFLIYDLNALLTLGYEAPFASDGSGPSGLSPEAAVLRQRYERELLGRLLQAPEVVSAMEVAITSGAPDPVRRHLLLLLMRLLAPHYPRVALLNPALVRDWSAPPSAEVDLDAALGQFERVSLFEQPVEHFLAEVGEHVRWGRLLHQEDFFELTHLEVLNSDHLRMGCRQLLQLDRELAGVRPLQLDLGRHDSEADTSFLDETHYPSGGLTGLTNRGSFESLVASELVYMDEEAAGTTLFNLRYVEGELLFYLRDSGVLRRKRRTIHLIIDLGGLFHVKASAYRYQYSVLAQGLALRLLRELFKIFETDALRFHFHYLPTGDAEGLRQEVAVMQLLLRDDARHDWVRFSTPESLDLDELTDPSRKTYVLVLAGPDQAEGWEQRLAQAEREGQPLHRVLLRFGADEPVQLSLPVEGLSQEELIGRKEEALTRILSER